MAIFSDSRIERSSWANADVSESEQPLTSALAERAQLASAYAEHGPRIHRFLRDLLGDATLANDATQETFARASRHLTELRDGRPPTPWLPWLFGIARNVSLEVRRARFRSARVISTTTDDQERSSRAATTESPERALLDREALLVVERALARLSEERRGMLVLRLDHGLTYEAIAETMGCSLAKVKVEIHRAREILRATMLEYQKGGVR